MKKLIIFLICLVSIIWLTVYLFLVKYQRLDVSLVNLLVNPVHYQGRLVRVIGVSQIEFEGNAIYLSKEDLKYGVITNALWMSPNYKALKKTVGDLEKYNGKYVLIEGRFNMFEKGHMGAYSGTIKDITRYVLWERERYE